MCKFAHAIYISLSINIIICTNIEMYQNGSQEKPHFELSYSTLDEYELSDLSPQSWADLVER